MDLCHVSTSKAVIQTDKLLVSFQSSKRELVMAQRHFQMSINILILALDMYFCSRDNNEW